MLTALSIALDDGSPGEYLKKIHIKYYDFHCNVINDAIFLWWKEPGSRCDKLEGYCREKCTSKEQTTYVSGCPEGKKCCIRKDAFPFKK